MSCMTYCLIYVYEREIENSEKYLNICYIRSFIYICMFKKTLFLLISLAKRINNMYATSKHNSTRPYESHKFKQLHSLCLTLCCENTRIDTR